MNNILLLSVVCSCISFTISEAKIFESFRKFLLIKSNFLGRLVSCGYCVGFWVSFFLVLIYRPLLFKSNFLFIDYFLTSLFIAWLAGFQWLLMSYLMTKSGK